MQALCLVNKTGNWVLTVNGLVLGCAYIVLLLANDGKTYILCKTLRCLQNYHTILIWIRIYHIEEKYCILFWRKSE